MEDLTMTISQRMWELMLVVDFEQQCHILATSPLLEEVWGNFQQACVQWEVTVPRGPPIQEEWAVHHCHTLPNLIILLSIDTLDLYPLPPPPTAIESGPQ